MIYTFRTTTTQELLELTAEELLDRLNNLKTLRTTLNVELEATDLVLHTILLAKMPPKPSYSDFCPKCGLRRVSDGEFSWCLNPQCKVRNQKYPTPQGKIKKGDKP